MRRPNILIFMTDQEQAQVSFPGHPCHTPNADRLAKDGILFRSCYTIAAHCCPSRASFMTGLYPSRHGIFNNVNTHTAIHRDLNDGVVMFSEGLKGAGYHLAYSGKWHVSNSESPCDRGWEELHVGARGERDPGHPKMDRFKPLADADGPRGRGQVMRPGWGNIQVYGTSKQTYEETNDYKIVHSAIDKLPELVSGDAPWCLFVGPNGPHDPFVVPEKYATMYDPTQVPLPPNFGDRMSDKPRIYQRHRKQLWDQFGEDEYRESIAHYWGYCTMMDDLFGEMLDALDKSGQAENTLVLRMSDHGEYAGAHGLYCKGVPAFREGYHIPLIARWPEGIQDPGREVDAFVNLMDFAPTFLDLAGVDDVPEGVAGRSLVPFLKGESPTDWRDAHCTQFNGVELYYTQRAVWTHSHKYVYNGFDFDELYDLEKDPHEMVNVAEDVVYDGVKRDLIKKMWEVSLAEKDIISNPYWTVGLVPYGPGITFE